MPQTNTPLPDSKLGCYIILAVWSAIAFVFFLIDIKLGLGFLLVYIPISVGIARKLLELHLSCQDEVDASDDTPSD